MSGHRVRWATVALAALCAAGEHQVCTRQTQPGFTHWGSMAEYVALDAADVNLVALPDGLDAARKVRPVVRRPLPPAGQTPGDAMD